jgi:hypothetical protein
LPRHILRALRRRHAGVVDQDVDRADLGLGMGHRRLDRVMVRHVELDDMGVTAGAVQLGPQVLELLDPAPGQHDRRAGRRERARELRAQAAGRACHKGDAPGKIDAVSHGGGSP